MMPLCSCSTPGRKPGTSQNVTNGMLKASHVRTNFAAFDDDSMSNTPAMAMGLLPTIPTGCPPSRANPQTMFGAHAALYSK